MSSVTSNYFDDKTPEEIINWMLEKLTEDQIKTCLDQAGIPDTSVIRQSDPPVIPSPPPPPPNSGGSGSGSDPGPPVTLELDQIRRSCSNRLILIESLIGNIVTFYEFSSNDDGDLVWTNINLPLEDFMRAKCSDDASAASNEILELDEEEKREMAPGLVIASAVPPQVIDLASNYNAMGLEQPLNVDLIIPAAAVEEPETIIYDEAISDAIKKQLSLDSVINKNYPEMYASGMTKFPIFVTDVSEDGKIGYISLVLKDDNTFGFRARKNGPALFLAQIKRDLKELSGKIEAASLTGWVKPTDYGTEIDNALRRWMDENPNNSQLYDKIAINYNPERLAQIKSSITTAFGEMVNREYYSEEPEMNTYFSGVRPSPVSSKNNINNMSTPELRERMVKLFGEEYAKTHEPVITYNRFGVKTVQYRKLGLPEKPIVLDPAVLHSQGVINKPELFTDFGTGDENFDLF
jgi:hypothetical protein